jgi:glyoxylase-like metal-dependent hydrolase (beta-lactamase superfamily II)
MDMENCVLNMRQKPEVTAFFDDDTNTVSYVVKDPDTLACAVIDSVMDFDYFSGRTGFKNADKIINFIRAEGLELEWIIETHVHADHLSAAPYFQSKLGGKLGIGEHITTVQETFGKIFNEGTQFQRDGSQFDHLFQDSDTYKIGSLDATVIYSPGHTPACTSHVIGNTIFVGDTLFMPDAGSARADFPGGDPGQLYDSIMKLLSFPDEMRLFMCHDYGPNGRAVAWETSVGEEKNNNIHVGDGKTKAAFIKMRNERDATLALPKLIIPSLQVNMRAGEIPKDDDGNAMLKIPVNKL